MGVSQFFHSCSEILINRWHCFILARGSAEIDDHTGPSVAEPKAGDNMVHGISLRLGRKNFFRRSSLRMWLSKLRSATRGLSCRFSTSRALSFLASLLSISPYLLLQLENVCSDCRTYGRDPWLWYLIVLSSESWWSVLLKTVSVPSFSPPVVNLF